MHNTISPGLGKIGVIVALEVDRRRGQAQELRQAGGDAYRRRQPASRRCRRPRSGLRRARARGSDRAGEGIGQAHARHREDGRGPLAQILRGGRAAVAGLRPRSARRPWPRRSPRPSKAPARPIKITGFHRFALGEGIDRPDSDFAAEVAAARRHRTRLKAIARRDRRRMATSRGTRQDDRQATAGSTRL